MGRIIIIIRDVQSAYKNVCPILSIQPNNADVFRN